MSASNVVIVESPAKCKTVNKYLGSDYIVLASFGHVRDLLAKDGSVRPDDDFAMEWEIGSRSKKHIKEIQDAIKDADTLYLATDPDREGEAISWHVQAILEDKKKLKGKTIKRVTFNEITKKAVQEAFQNARELDTDLIDAYLARRALDYLVGFNLSPVLWRKLPGSKSAGRVQSVALRLICERESEIEIFKAQEYWSIDATLHTPDGAPFEARLTHLSGNKLDKLDIGTQDEADHAVDRILNKSLSVQTVKKKQSSRNPSPPFITSTLQQEAARKLYFSATQTMRTAQKLYEGISLDGETVGLITYMRTDGTTLSQDAVNQARSQIGKQFGDNYVPDAPRLFKSKAKNAQEAHEAIRPTDLSRTPKMMRPFLDDHMFKLYDLIWKRTMASQMASAVFDQVVAEISDGTDDAVLRANGSVIKFDGFLTLYQEGNDDGESNEKDRRLPEMNQGDALKTISVTPDQHFTQPPPRYSEASLVKKMEELGIGRPSTYASILQVLRDRGYVRSEKRRFFPEDRGRLVTTFLMKFFTRYVDYEFTANLEDELDAISAGKAEWKEALRLFWKDFSHAIGETKELTITNVLDELDSELGDHFFPVTEENPTPRKCPDCSDGSLSLKLGKFGAFIGCSNYPECKHTRPLEVPSEEADEERKAESASGLNPNEPKELGTDPDTGRTVTLRKGPYGWYVQLDLPPEAKKKDKPKRQGIPKGSKPEDMTFEAALKLLALPRDVGEHPETGEMIQAGVGRFGPYLKHAGKFISLPKDDDLLTIGINRAVTVIADDAEKKAKKAAEKGEGKEKKTPAKKAPAKKKTTAKKSTAKKTTTKKKKAS